MKWDLGLGHRARSEDYKCAMGEKRSLFGDLPAAVKEMGRRDASVDGHTGRLRFRN
jgi:hypothetical protein